MQHLKPRSTSVVLYQGDDMDRLAQLRKAISVAERIHETAESEAGSSVARMGDEISEKVTSSAAALETARREFDAFVDEAAERALTVELRSIGRRRFRDLLLDHAPRMVDGKPDAEGKPAQVVHEDDMAWGVNTETFPAALLCYQDGDSVTIAQPEFPSKADLERFVDDELAEGDFEQLWVAAFMLNRSPSNDPKGQRYMTASPSTDET